MGDDGSDILVTSTPGAEFASAEVKFKWTLVDGDRLTARLVVVVTP